MTTLGERLSQASQMAREGWTKAEIARRTGLTIEQVEEVLVLAKRRKRK